MVGSDFYIFSYMLKYLYNPQTSVHLRSAIITSFVYQPSRQPKIVTAYLATFRPGRNRVGCREFAM